MDGVVFLAVASVYLVGRVIPSLTIHAFNLFRAMHLAVFFDLVFALSGSQALFNRALSLPARVGQSSRGITLYLFWAWSFVGVGLGACHCRCQFWLD